MSQTTNQFKYINDMYGGFKTLKPGPLMWWRCRYWCSQLAKGKTWQHRAGAIRKFSVQVTMSYSNTMNFWKSWNVRPSSSIIIHHPSSPSRDTKFVWFFHATKPTFLTHHWNPLKARKGWIQSVESHLQTLWETMSGRFWWVVVMWYELLWDVMIQCHIMSLCYNIHCFALHIAKI